MGTNEGITELGLSWAARGIAGADLTLDTDGTIGRTLPAPGTTSGTDLLPELVADVGPLLSLGPTLAEGGMGVVRLGTQHGLERSVAIKAPHQGAEMAAAVLLEGRITGFLEHPNVVPVYAIGKDATGQPLVVMKRIEGRSWKALLGGRPASSEDALLRHLEILLQVADALEFAHARGVLHRDVKPDNVMVGSFGEVYLVDWGLAASLPHGPANLPPAREVRVVAGTPGYMAPEMAEADGKRLGPATDVYLLGATLHEVLTGVPPHVGGTLLEILVSAHQSAPRAYPGLPVVLQEVCRRAMSREVESRFASAAAFREAVTAYFRHRASLQLVEEAHARLAELRARLAAGERYHEDLAHPFTECRLTFAQAARTWSGNPSAAKGQQALVELMIRSELAAGGARAAQALLAELPEPNPALGAEVEAAVSQLRAREEALSRHELERDPRVGARDRVALALAVGAAFGLVFAGMGALRRSGEQWVDNTVLSLVFLLLTAILSILVFGVGWPRLLSTQMNRQLTLTLVAFGVLAAGFAMVCHLLGLSLGPSFVLGEFLTGATWTVAAICLDRRLFTVAVPVLACVPLPGLFPEYAPDLFGGVVVASSWTLAAVWERLARV